MDGTGFPQKNWVPSIKLDSLSFWRLTRYLSSGSRRASHGFHITDNFVWCSLVPRISRLKTTTTPRWQKQFTNSLLALRDAQLRTISYQRKGTILALDDYIDLSRDLSGLRMVFDLVESSEGLNLDLTEMTLDDADDFRMLRRVAAEFIALSFVRSSPSQIQRTKNLPLNSKDIFMLNNDQLAANKLNVVEVLMTERDLSLQAAVNEAAHLVKEEFDAFQRLETSLWGRHPRENANGSPASGLKEQNATLGATLSTWIRKPLSRSSSRTNLAALFSASEATKWDTSTANDASLFLQGLRDCMGGSLHWAYETELFFGSKGEAIRNFGWIFLPSQDG